MMDTGVGALSRRAVVRGALAMSGLAVLAACGGAEKAATTSASAAGKATTAPAAAAATAIPTTAAASLPAPVTTSVGGASMVNVVLKEFSIAFDTATVKAGTVTFLIRDSGTFSHNFNVQLDGKEMGIATIDSGTTTTLKLDLKPGTYLCHCLIAGHEQLGMVGMLTVT